MDAFFICYLAQCKGVMHSTSHWTALKVAAVLVMVCLPLGVASPISRTATASRTLKDCASFPVEVAPSTRELPGDSISEGRGSGLFVLGGSGGGTGIFAAYDDVSSLVQLEIRKGVRPTVTTDLMYPISDSGPLIAATSTQTSTTEAATGFSAKLSGHLRCSVPSSTSLVSCEWPAGVGAGYESFEDAYVDVFLLVSPALTLNHSCRIPRTYLVAPASKLSPNTPLLRTLGGVSLSGTSDDTVRMYTGSVVIRATSMNAWWYVCLRWGLLITFGLAVVVFGVYGDLAVVDVTIAVILLGHVCATTTDHAHAQFAKYIFRPLSSTVDVDVEVALYGAVLLALLLISAVLLAWGYWTESVPTPMQEELEGPISRWFSAASASWCAPVLLVPCTVLLPGTVAATCELYTVSVESGFGASSILYVGHVAGPLYCLVVLVSCCLISNQSSGSVFANSAASTELRLAIPGLERPAPLAAVCVVSPWYVRYMATSSSKDKASPRKLPTLKSVAAAALFIRKKKRPKTYDENGNSVGSSDRDEDAAVTTRGGMSGSFTTASPMNRRLSPVLQLVPLGPSEAEYSPLSGLVPLGGPSPAPSTLIPVFISGESSDRDPFDSIRRAATRHREVVRRPPQPPSPHNPLDLIGVATCKGAVVRGIDVSPSRAKYIFFPYFHWLSPRHRGGLSFILGGAASVDQLCYLVPILPHLVAVCVAALAYSGSLSCQSRGYGYAGAVGGYAVLLCTLRPYRYFFTTVLAMLSSLLLCAFVALSTYSLHAQPVSTVTQVSKDALLGALILVILARTLHLLFINLFIASGVESVLDHAWRQTTAAQERVYMYHRDRSEVPPHTPEEVPPVTSTTKFALQIPVADKNEASVNVVMETPGGPTSSMGSVEDVTPYPDDDVAPDEDEIPHRIVTSSPSSAQGSSRDLKRTATLVRKQFLFKYSNPTVPDADTLDADYRLSSDAGGCIVITRADGKRNSFSDADDGDEEYP